LIALAKAQPGSSPLRRPAQARTSISAASCSSCDRPDILHVAYKGSTGARNDISAVTST